jgi:nucleotide-binding universal stress UspA family protein
VMTYILVPTDFSESSLAAVQSGIELANAVGGVVVLLHVIEGASVHSYAIGGLPLYFSDMIYPGGECFRSPSTQKLMRRDVCEDALRKLDALVPPSCQASVHTMVTVGRVVEEIIRVAKAQHAELILMGARRRRGWRQVFRRTTADRLRREALIPVVTLDANDLCGGRDPGRRGSGRSMGRTDVRSRLSRGGRCFDLRRRRHRGMARLS